MSDYHDADLRRSGSLPSPVPPDFIRNATLRMAPPWRSASSRTQTPADEEERRRSTERQDRNFRRWLAAARRSLASAPGRFEARSTTSSGWNVFVNVIEILHRGKAVLTLPDLHGWPIEGPRGRTTGTEAAERILKTLSETAREDGSASFASDVAAAAPLFGAIVSTTRQDLNEAFQDDEGRLWMIVEIEQEDGLPSCVLDPSDADGADEAVAWHPPASASTAIPLRLSCERSGRGWRIDSRRWKEPALAIRTPSMDAMEVLRLASTHID